MNILCRLGLHRPIMPMIEKPWHFTPIGRYVRCARCGQVGLKFSGGYIFFIDKQFAEFEADVEKIQKLTVLYIDGHELISYNCISELHVKDDDENGIWKEV